jgi:Domain of unknown function (DUF5615)
MKFLVDAHLPLSLCAVLARHGHDANYTLDLPAKNATKDSILNQISLDEQRVVISNFERHLSEITAALEQYTLVEIDRASVTPRLQS